MTVYAVPCPQLRTNGQTKVLTEAVIDFLLWLNHLPAPRFHRVRRDESDALRYEPEHDW